MVIAYEMVKRGFDRGRAEGRTEGRAEASRIFAAYLKRMKEAHARGEDFNEPPPSFGAGDNEQQG